METAPLLPDGSEAGSQALTLLSFSTARSKGAHGLLGHSSALFRPFLWPVCGPHTLQPGYQEGL